MIHSIQAVLPDSTGKLYFVVVKNIILALEKDRANGRCSLVGKWIDELDRNRLIKEKVRKEQVRQLEQNKQAGVVKKSRSNNGEPIKRTEAKIPVPGAGAPPIYPQVRNLILSHDESMLIACTDSDKAVLVFKIDRTNGKNILVLYKRQPYPKRPNAISITEDDQTVLVADKFGDVYAMPINAETKESISDENEPILGHVSMLTDILLTRGSNGKHYVITSDRDEHIKISHYPQSFMVDKWLFGHKEFVSCMDLAAWKPNWLLSAGGDTKIFLWDWETGAKLDEYDYTDVIQPYLSDKHFAPERFQNSEGDVVEFCVSKAIFACDIPYVAFVVENTKMLIILKCDTKEGRLSLHQMIEMPATIVSLEKCSTANGFVVSLDTRESEYMVRYVKHDSQIEKFSIDEESSTAVDQVLVDTLTADPIVDVDPKDMNPLYTVIALKKHGEHYS